MNAAPRITRVTPKIINHLPISFMAIILLDHQEPRNVPGLPPKRAIGRHSPDIESLPPWQAYLPGVQSRHPFCMRSDSWTSSLVSRSYGERIHLPQDYRPTHGNRTPLRSL